MVYTLITGASGGIGHALAIECAKHGEHLILTGRNEKKLQQIKEHLEKEYRTSVEMVLMDLGKTDAAKELHAITQKQGWQVETLINNAGFGDATLFLDSNLDRQTEMVQLNITALMQATYLYGNDMKKRSNGRILNVASVAAFVPRAKMSVYYASKSFVFSFSLALSEELKGTDVTVTAVCPGPTATEFEKTANLVNSTMFTFTKPAKPEIVAKRAYLAMVKGKPFLYHSPLTHFTNIASRISSRTFAARCTRKINDKSKG